MLRVGFESTISAFERAKTVHALDCAATVTGNDLDIGAEFLSLFNEAPSGTQVIYS
jgi:hypothetical protein